MQNGFIIREETVIQGENIKNGITQVKAEGEKVSKGACVFRYIIKNEESINENISKLDEQINEAMSNQQNLFSADIKLLETQIEEKLDVLYNENELEKLREYKKDIDGIITKKAQIAGALSPSASYIQDLINQRASLLEQLASSSEEIYAANSGIVSYRVDGLENVLIPGDFSYLNKDFLDGLNLKTGQIIASSNENGKVINNFNCYIATIMNSENAKNAKIGDKVNIRLLSNDETSAKIIHISDEDNGKLIVFEINTYVEKLISYRKVLVEVIWWQDSGLKVPNNAIIYKNNIAYITRTKGGYLDDIPVKVLRSNENYSIIENYTKTELEDLGFENVKSIRSISMYDDVVIK